MSDERAQISPSTVPVTVLTGYLGAGKTTLLNRILTEDHGKKYAVIVNEFGEIGIDNDLVVDTDEEIFEMNNGCVCCTVRGDLIRILNGLMKRIGGFDGILIETTGLADPAPVAQTFFMDDDVRAKTHLDAVVTVVDGKHIAQRLKDAPEAREQIAFGDVILLNKTDLLNDGELADIEQSVRAINPYAVLRRTVKSDIALNEILDRGAFDLERILDIEPSFLTEDHSHHEHDHHHHEHGHDHHHYHHGRHAHDMGSVSLRTDKMLNPSVFFPWINSVVDTLGPEILRTKGILAFKDDDERYVLQGVHMIIEGDSQQPWRDDEKRESRLVFIGRNLNAQELEAGFMACVAS